MDSITAPWILDHPDPLAALGVRSFVNAAGPRTIQSGSRVDPRVRAVMERVADVSVDLDELAEAASVRLAQRLSVGSGLVTSGCFAALVIAAQACADGADPLRLLPERRLRAMRRCVLVPHAHRSIYDQAYAVAGLEIVCVTAPSDLARIAADANPVCLGVIGACGEPAETRAWLEAARDIGLPSIVDAAAERLDSPEYWTRFGADLVAYSCGKTLYGPHAAGLLLGRAELVEAARRHAAPHQGPGRGYKVGKETLVGALAAVDLAISDGRAKSERRWDADIATMTHALSSRGLRCERVEGHVRVGVPRLRVSWDTGPIRVDAVDLYRRLDEATPRVVLRELGARGRAIEIDPSCFREGDADIVCNAVAQALTPAESGAAGLVSTPSIDLEGAWRIDMAIAGAPRRIDLDLGPDGTGACRTGEDQGAATARSSGSTIDLVCAFGANPTITYRLRGTRAGDGFAGEALLGFSNPDDPGPDRSADQFGRARFVMTPARPLR